MPEAMLVLSPQRFIVDANPAFEALLSPAADSCVGSPLNTVLPSLADALGDFAEGPFRERQDGHGEFRCEIKVGGAPRVYQCTVQCVAERDDVGAQSLLLLRDITTQQRTLDALEDRERELRHANAALERMSMTDALTG